jgi:aldehyde dehydrogenase (NAD+)
VSHADIIELDARLIAQCFDAQQATALRLRNSVSKQRKRKLAQLRDALLARRDALYKAFHEDFRKPAAEVDLTEILPVVDEIQSVIRNLHRWMRLRWVMPTLMMLGNSARVTYQGKGRCLIIGPWNYPVATLIGPLVSAIAAGNTVILKPSEFTPAVNQVLAEVIAEVFDPTEVSLIEGGVETAQTLLKLPFDHIFFTGSPAVGKLVMAAAARHLASVTLELGGKSPVIVDGSADLRRAAETIMWGKLVNGGQTCIAPDTLFVERSVRDELMRHCKEVIAERYGHSDTEIAASPDLARMIDQSHAGRVAELIDSACEAGAQKITGGTHDASQCHVAPTLLGNVPPMAQIAQQEIFGPVLPVVEFDDIGEVISHIIYRPKPLALYLWSKRQKTIRRVLRETSSGSAVVNHCIVQFAHSGLPFGGIGHSGIGNAHGYYGFKAFSHERAMLYGGWLQTVKLFFPPYTPGTRRLIGAMLALLRRI